ncbi:alpha/beta fold hydrolase [Streptomyces sp. MCAF7]
MLDNLTLYWVTRTGPSAARYYFENFATVTDIVRQPPATVPTAFAQFPADIQSVPRSFVERSFDIQQWTEMPAGGHFTAWEQPQPLADDIRTFFSTKSRRSGRDDSGL